AAAGGPPARASTEPQARPLKGMEAATTRSPPATRTIVVAPRLGDDASDDETHARRGFCHDENGLHGWRAGPGHLRRHRSDGLWHARRRWWSRWVPRRAPHAPRARPERGPEAAGPGRLPGTRPDLQAARGEREDGTRGDRGRDVRHRHRHAASARRPGAAGVAGPDRPDE